MTVKTYRARTMQEALALVRQELGSQASVLHTREVRSRGLARLWGGVEMVEVVASDNVSVPGRLPESFGADPFGPDPYWNAERSVPHSLAGIDLTEIASQHDKQIEKPAETRSRVAAYLEQGLQPLAADGATQQGRVRGGAPLLLVCGAHGAGSTTVSWKLAQSLASQGRRAVWVDADLRANPSSHPSNHREGSLADVLAGRRTVHEVLSLGPDGVQCVRRAQGEKTIVPGMADAQRCVWQLQGLSPYAEVVIVDAGSEANMLRAQLWEAASAVCVVVSPADDAILQGYACIKSHRLRSRTTELVMFVNRAEAPAAECVAGRMAKACRRFLELKLSLAGHLPASDPRTSNFSLDAAAERMWDLLGSSESRAASELASKQNL